MIKGPRHLYLVSPKNEPLIEGPITRLDLWQRFPPVPKVKIGIFVLSKLIVLSVVLYVMLSR